MKKEKTLKTGISTPNRDTRSPEVIVKSNPYHVGQRLQLNQKQVEKTKKMKNKKIINFRENRIGNTMWFSHELSLYS